MKAVIIITGHISSVQEISKALWRGNKRAVLKTVSGT